jgi:regulator of PEP synthase PpsR (kinase-PPPase family)
MTSGVHKSRIVYAVSDGTGNTCETVIKSALAQFADGMAQIQKVPHIRTEAQVKEVLEDAAQKNAVVIYTTVSPDIREKILSYGQSLGVPTVDILGPILSRLSDLLEISPLAIPGIFRELDSEYFQRIEAMDFTVKHDDGLNQDDLDKAEIVLLGISRTAKTPTSIYLAYRGWRVANIPIIMDMEIPEQVFRLDQRKVVGFTVSPERLRVVRVERLRKLVHHQTVDYTNLAAIHEEVIYANRLILKNRWPLIDVTFKSIEETATEVMRIIYREMGVRKGRYESLSEQVAPENPSP